MSMRTCPRRPLKLLIALALASFLLSITDEEVRGSRRTARGLPCRVLEIAPGWRLAPLMELPEHVTSLRTTPDDSPIAQTAVFAGTSPRGGVYRFDGVHTFHYRTLADSLSDLTEHGECAVNHLAFRDIDHDGTPELLAQTCQIVPQGRPRAYVWSMTSPPTLRGFARPAIDSSWSHGLAFVDGPDGPGAPRIFSTFCGFGEIVEFQAHSTRSEDGFQRDSIGWRQVGQLPCSGEQAEAADLDGDGQQELIFAAGFKHREAALHAFHAGAPNGGLVPRWDITEEGKYANVRFLIGGPQRDGRRWLIAWWCTDLAGGRCDIIRYEIGPTGPTQRTPIASLDNAWPADGQMALAHTDSSGRDQVWFSAGNALWRYDPDGPPRIERILRIEGALGPVSPSPQAWPGVLLGWKRHVLRLDREGTERLPPGRWRVPPRPQDPVGIPTL